MKNKIKILWLFSSHCTKQASTRIRAFSLYKNFSEHSYFKEKCIVYMYFCKMGKKINVEVNPDVIINQKRFDQETLNFIEKNKKNKLIIYDYDDFIYHYPLFSNFVNSSDLVTTDTLEKKEYFDKYKFNKKCYVLPDCIDYFPNCVRKPTKFNKKICWFGYSKYISLIKWQLDYLSNIDYKVDIITGWALREGDRRLKGLSNINLIRWKTDTFISKLRKSSISLLSHSKKKKMRGKSNNKMLVAITNGLPCIISNSYSYEELAKKFDLDYSIVSNEDELKYALDYLSNYKNRKKYLKDIQPYIWENYNGFTISKKLFKLIRDNL